MCEMERLSYLYEPLKHADFCRVLSVKFKNRAAGNNEIGLKAPGASWLFTRNVLLLLLLYPRL